MMDNMKRLLAYQDLRTKHILLVHTLVVSVLRRVGGVFPTPPGALTTVLVRGGMIETL
jgi:hypothetical protein